MGERLLHFQLNRNKGEVRRSDRCLRQPADRHHRTPTGSICHEGRQDHEAWL